MKKLSFIALAFAMLAATAIHPTATHAAECPTLEPGDIFKGQSTTGVYMLNPQMKRAPFYNGDVYESWYSDFADVQVIPDICVGEYQVGSSMTFRPGSRLVKGVSPKVYAIFPGDKLVEIQDEEVARNLYGNNWDQKIRVLDDFYFDSYIRTTDVLDEKTPHDGMLIRNNNEVFHMENGEPIRVKEDAEFFEDLDVLDVNDDDFEELPKPYSFEWNEKSYDEYRKRDSLDSSISVLLSEQRILNSSMVNANDLLSIRMEGSLRIQNENATYGNDPISETLENGRATFDIAFDKHECDYARVEASATLESEKQGIFRKSVVADLTYFQNGSEDDADLYFKTKFFNLEDFADSEESVIYDIIQDNWIHYNKVAFEESAEKWLEEIEDGVGSEASLSSTKEPCTERNLFSSILSEGNVLVATENLGSSTVNEKPAFHYAVTIDKTNLEHALAKTRKSLNSSSLSDIGAADSIISILEDGNEIKNAEIWIDQRTQLPLKFTIEVDSYNTYSGVSEGTLEIELSFSDFNKSFDISAPEKSTPLFDIFKLILEEFFKALENELEVPTEETTKLKYTPEWFDVAPVDFSRDNVIGPADAPITIIEYTDFECPFCQRFHSTMKEIREEYSTDVKWVIRHFPLSSIHPDAESLAHVTQCAADQGKFWEVADLVFEDQRLNIKYTEDRLMVYSNKANLSLHAFEECVEVQRHADHIQEDMTDGANAGANGTPYSIMIDPNNNMLPIHGAQPYEAVESQLKLMLDSL